MQPSPVAAYLDALTRELAFDPPLCRRVREEVQGHLCEALDAQAAEPTWADETRAVERFGSPRALADQYRVLSAFTRVRRSGLVVVLAVAGVFIAMEARISWYALTQWRASEKLQAISAVALPIDKYAFLLAAAFGIAGWLYAMTLPIPPALRSAALAPLRRCHLLFGMSALSISVAVGIELFLSLYRFAEASMALNVVFPGATILLEAAIVVAAALTLRRTARRLQIPT